MYIRASTVSRNDLVFEIHADVVQTKTGKIICFYRESDFHDPVDFSTVVYRISLDAGRTWGPRTLFVDSRGKDRKFNCWKCPRISRLTDDRLVVICDVLTDYESARTTQIAPNYLWWSKDDGETWSGPYTTPIRGIVPSKVTETQDGNLMVATCYWDEKGMITMAGWRSEDGGDSWDGPITIARGRREQHKVGTEGNFALLANGTLVCYMRASPALKSFSRDDGKTWEGPYKTLMYGCSGRPGIEFLKSGKILVTYRYIGNHNLFGYLESQESTFNPDPKKQAGRIIPIAHDHNPRSDIGYTGVVQLSRGDILSKGAYPIHPYSATHPILVIGAIMKEAPRTYIEAYRFREEDI
jgi:sialidase-1